MSHAPIAFLLGRSKSRKKKKTHLSILQPQQKYIFHQSQFRLLAPFLSLTEISRVERDLVAIFPARERRLRSSMIQCRAIPRYGRRHPALIVVVCATATSPASQAPG